MNKKYFAGLLGVSAVMAALCVAVLFTFAVHEQFRRTVGHDQPSWDQFAAKVESGPWNYRANFWFLGMQDDHQVIQMEERSSDRMADLLATVGALGLLTVLFQAWAIFTLQHKLPHDEPVLHGAA